jgi:transposase
MGQNFIACDRRQVLLMPPDLTHWVAEDHLVWSILGAVEQMNLSAFYGAYRENGQGRAAYDPAMMVTLLLYAYARGTRSSRQIERACGEDVVYKLICAMQVPDHSTIAEFRRRHETAIAELFNSVLMLCQEAGLVDVGVISIDGTKIRANASRGANRTYEKLVADILKEAEETDEWEDGLFGPDRDHELPEHLRTEEGRRQAFASARRRLEEQTGRDKPPENRVVELDPECVPKGRGRRGWQREAQKQLMARREAAAQPIARSRPERLLESVERLEENHQVDIAANAAYERWWATRGQSGLVGNRLGMAPKAFVAAAEPEGQINKSDHDSRMMLTVGQPTGQSYNAQAAVTADQIIVAAEISVQSPDFGHLKPTLAPHSASSGMRRSRTARGLFLLTPAIGINSRSKRSSPAASRSSFLLTAGYAPTSGPAGTRACIGSCAQCLPASWAVSFTSCANQRSSRCSARSSSTDGSPGSSAAGDPPHSQNGGSLPPRTT